MKNQESKFRIVIVGVSLLLASPVHAFNIGNMMNPSKWMGGNSDRDRYDDYYGGPGYGYGGPGYGYGGPGYGYGGPGYGYGGPGYGGYGYGAPGYGGVSEYAPPGTNPNDAEIDRLKERLRQLEGVVK